MKRAAAFFIFLFFLSLFTLTMQGVPVGGDARVMFKMTRSLVDRGSVFIPHDPKVHLVPARDGKYTSKYPLGQSLAEAPLYVAGREVVRSKGLHGSYYGEFLVYFITALTTPLVSALWCALVFLFALRLGHTARLSAGLALLTGLGTLVLPHSKALFSEPLQGLLLTLACYCIFRAFGGDRGGGTGWAAACGLSLGFLILTKPLNVILLPVFLVYILWKWKERKRGWGALIAILAAVGVPVLIGIGGALLFNHARFGDPLDFGYFGRHERDELFKFSVPLWVGLHGLLISTGKGLFFYVPVAWLLFFCWRGFARERPAEAVLFFGAAAVLLVVYAKWNQWHGDYTWGPRFLVPLMGLMALALGDLFRDAGRWRWWGKWAVGAVVAASVSVQVLGTAVNFNEYIGITKRQVPYGILFEPGRVELRDDLLLAHFVPEFSPIAGHWWLLKHAVKGGDREARLERMKKDFPWKGLAGYIIPSDPVDGTRWDFWWHYFPEFFPDSRGWVGLVGLLAAALLAVSGALMLTSIRRTNYG